MGATQSTLAATQESFSKQQDQPSESVVTQEGNTQTPATDKLDTPTDSISPDATPTQSALEQQEDIVDFSLSIGKESNNPEQSKSETRSSPSSLRCSRNFGPPPRRRKPRLSVVVGGRGERRSSMLS